MSTTLTIRVDEYDAKEFKAFCKSVGVTPSTAIRVFIKQVIREGDIPFTIKNDPFFSKTNQQRLKESIKELTETGGTVHDIDLDA